MPLSPEMIFGVPGGGLPSTHTSYSHCIGDAEGVGSIASQLFPTYPTHDPAVMVSDSSSTAWSLPSFALAAQKVQSAGLAPQ